MDSSNGASRQETSVPPDGRATPIYFDHNATTPVDPHVVDARTKLALLLGVASDEIVFTGSGSEANNLAIKGIANALASKGKHLITSTVEHPAVLAPMRFLERKGFRITILPVDNYGRVDPNDVAALGCAAELATANLRRYSHEVPALRDDLHARILSNVPDAQLNGHPTTRLPNTLNLSFPGIDAAALMAEIREHVACSTGSACHSHQAKPSRVLLAMGFVAARASSALRLSLSFTTTRPDIGHAASAIAEAVKHLRHTAPASSRTGASREGTLDR